MALSDSEIPYISVVAVARSANPSTLRAFVESWTLRAAGCGVSSELILVAYGALDLVADGIRVIEVPAGVPEMKARNAGIRRARGEFILSTEIDTEYSDELMQFLASRRLQKSRFYRADRRDDRLHARQGSFRLTVDGLRENQAQDIAGIQSGIHFGDGWFPPEHDTETGEVFRWIENAAEVTLRAPGHGGELTLELEPGPGVGPLPQVLQAIDEAGNIVAEWTVSGRIAVRLWVPQAAPGTMQSFRLSVPDGGRALLDDLRILNFRFFRCDWTGVRSAVGPGRSYAGMRATLTRLLLAGGLVRLPRAVRQLRGVGDDVFGAGIAHWGRGWHRLEESGTEKFRWASTDAELVVRSDGGQQALSLLIEPGPSLHGQPFDLLVRLAGGKSIGRVKISGLTVVKIPIPAPPGAATAMYLSPDRLGEALPGDSRVLNFRVLACSCEAAASPLPVAELTDRRNWTTVTLGEKPAGIDWAVRLQNDRLQLAEIGRPPFLHVNACDFILMDRDRWFDLRGYPESDDTPERLSALFCHNAHFAGVQEEVLAEALRMDGAPRRDQTAAAFDAELVWLITQMRRLRAPAILNLDTWGLAGSALRETSALTTHAGGSEE